MDLTDPCIIFFKAKKVFLTWPFLINIYIYICVCICMCVRVRNKYWMEVLNYAKQFKSISIFLSEYTAAVFHLVMYWIRIMSSAQCIRFIYKKCRFIDSRRNLGVCLNFWEYGVVFTAPQFNFGMQLKHDGLCLISHFVCLYGSLSARHWHMYVSIQIMHMLIILLSWLMWCVIPV